MTNEFFTWAGLGALTTASAAVIVVSNTLRSVFGVSHKGVPLLVALLVVLGVAGQQGALAGLSSYGLALLNGCLLYCTATGANEAILSANETRPSGAKPFSKVKPKWLSSWLR